MPYDLFIFKQCDFSTALKEDAENQREKNVRHSVRKSKVLRMQDSDEA